MPQLTAADLWKALGRSGLLGPAALSALQREHARKSGGATADAGGIAAWLVDRGSLTRWQAKRLLAGEKGPFFLGEYRLLERHEHPGNVPLFTARHDPSGRTVDVVLLSSRRCQDPSVWEGVVRRTSAAIAATDPTLSRTWAVEQSEAARFIVCERVEGESLSKVLARHGRMPPRTAGVLALRIARAIASLHRRGDVHGGLSLEAVRLAGGEAALDPATARVLQYPLVGDPHGDPPRVALATDEEIERLGMRAACVAPELTLPQATCDVRSDVYAIGCVLHALLTGQPPGWRGDPRATLRQAATTGVPPLGPPVVPEEVGTLVAYLTARDPESRYRTADEAAEAIAACFAIEAEPPFVGVNEALPALAVNASPAGKPVSRRKPARRGGPLVPAGVVFAALSLVVAAVAWFDPLGLRGRRGPEPAPVVVPDVDSADVAAKDAEAGNAPGMPAQQEEPAKPGTGPMVTTPASTTIVVEDGSLPWVAPTSGTPLDLTYLPGGAQLILAVRPAEILADEEGLRFFKALGPAAEAAATWLAGICGCGLEGIESVHAAWQAAADGTSLGACVVRLAGGRTIPDEDAFRGRQWGVDGAKQLDGETVHHAGRWSFWRPKAAVGRVLVVAPDPLIDDIVRGGTTPPSLSGDLETLVTALDESRHLTVAVATHYLFTEGRGMLAGPLERLAAPLESFLGDDVRAAAVAAHFGTSFFVEFDAAGSLDAAAAGLAPALRERLDAMPDAVEEYTAALAVHPHGRRLVLRLSPMLRALVANLRSGPEGQVAVLNAYLPRHAGHNLALASELALAQAPGGDPVAVATTATAPPATAQDAVSKLRKPMTLVFARDTLEKSVQMIADEIGVPIEINGRDLELEGITKNQSFGLSERDSTADAILRVILAKSNPDGKLVYVVRQQGGAETVEITTRAAVAKRGDTLPPGFEAGSGTEGTGEKR